MTGNGRLEEAMKIHLRLQSDYSLTLLFIVMINRVRTESRYYEWRIGLPWTRTHRLPLLFKVVVMDTGVLYCRNVPSK